MLILNKDGQSGQPAPERTRLAPTGQYRPNRTPRDLTQKEPQERRVHKRYATRLPLLYHVMHRQHVVQSGSGITANMSSGGIWFRADSVLSVGLAVELLIEWPATPRHQGPVLLNVQGRVVRAGHQGVAVRIERYSFESAPVVGGPTGS
jgi:hypothetical protein